MCRVGPESRESIPVQPSPAVQTWVFDLTEWMPFNHMVTESGSSQRSRSRIPEPCNAASFERGWRSISRLAGDANALEMPVYGKRVKEWRLPHSYRTTTKNISTLQRYGH